MLDEFDDQQPMQTPRTAATSERAAIQMAAGHDSQRSEVGSKEKQDRIAKVKERLCDYFDDSNHTKFRDIMWRFVFTDYLINRWPTANKEENAKEMKNGALRCLTRENLNAFSRLMRDRNNNSSAAAGANAAKDTKSRLTSLYRHVRDFKALVVKETDKCDDLFFVDINGHNPNSKEVSDDQVSANAYESMIVALRKLGQKLLHPLQYEYGFLDSAELVEWESELNISFERIDELYSPQFAEKPEEETAAVLTHVTEKLSELNIKIDGKIGPRDLAANLFQMFKRLHHVTKEADDFARKQKTLILLLQKNKECKVFTNDVQGHLRSWSVEEKERMAEEAVKNMPPQKQLDLCKQLYAEGVISNNELNMEEMEKKMESLKKNIGRDEVDANVLHIVFDGGDKLQSANGADIHRRLLLDHIQHVERSLKSFYKTQRLAMNQWPGRRDEHALSVRIDTEAQGANVILVSSSRLSLHPEDKGGRKVAFEAGPRCDGYYHIERPAAGMTGFRLTWSESNEDEKGQKISEALEKLHREHAQPANKELELSFPIHLPGHDLEEEVIVRLNHKSNSAKVQNRGSDEAWLKRLDCTCTTMDGQSGRFIRMALLVEANEIGGPHIKNETVEDIFGALQGAPVRENAKTILGWLGLHCHMQVSEQVDDVQIPRYLEHSVTERLAGKFETVYDSLLTRWQQALFDRNTKAVKDEAAHFIYANLPKSSASSSQRFWALTKSQCHQVSERLQEAPFNFPLEEVTINQSCFPSKFELLKKLADVPHVNFACITFDGELAQEELRQLMKLCSECSLRVFTPAVPWLIEACAWVPSTARVSSDALNNTQLNHVVLHDPATSVGYLVNSAARNVWPRIAGIQPASDVAEHREEVLEKYRLVSISPKRGVMACYSAALRHEAGSTEAGVQFVSLLIHTSQTAEEIASKFTSLSTNPFHEMEMGSLRQVNWAETLVNACAGQAKYRLLIRSPEQLNLLTRSTIMEHVATVDKPKEVVFLTVNSDFSYRHDPRNMNFSICSPQQQAAREKQVTVAITLYDEHKADSSNSGFQWIRSDGSDEAERVKNRLSGDCRQEEEDERVPFPFFVRHAPVAEFLPQIKRVELFFRWMYGKPLAKEDVALINNADSEYIDIKSTPNTEPCFLTRCEGLGTSFEKVAAIAARGGEANLPWQEVSNRWARGFPFSNDNLGCILAAHPNPLRILLSIPANNLFSRLSVLRKIQGNQAWASDIARRLREQHTSLLLSTDGLAESAGWPTSDSTVARIKASLSALKLYLCLQGERGVEVSSDDYERIVSCSIFVDPLELESSDGQLQPQWESMVTLLLRMDGPFLLFFNQPKIKEYFLAKLDAHELVSFVEKQEWGSAFVSLMLESLQAGSSRGTGFAARSARIGAMLAWYGDTPGVTIGGCFTDKAIAYLIKRAKNETAITSVARMRSVDQATRLVALLRRGRDGKGAWRRCSFEFQSGKKHKDLARKCSDGFVAHGAGGKLDAVVRELCARRCGFDEQLFPETSAVVMQAFAQMAKEPLVELLNCIKTAFPPADRARFVASVMPTTLRACAAAWLYNPLQDFHVDPTSEQGGAVISELAGHVSRHMSPIAAAFLRTCEDNLSNIPPLALALSNHREILDLFTYTAFQPLMPDWPVVEPVQYLLRHQGDASGWPPYVFTFASRRLPTTVLQKLFAPRSIKLEVGSSASDRDYDIMSGVSPELIRKNMNFVANASRNAANSGHPQEVKETALIVLLWFRAMGILLSSGPTSKGELMQSPLVACVQADQQDMWAGCLAAILSVSFRVHTVVMTPQPSSLDVRLRAGPTTVELFGTEPKDLVHTRRVLSGYLAASLAANDTCSLDAWNRTGFQKLAMACVDEAKADAGNAAKIAENFINAVLYVRGEQHPDCATMMLKHFGECLQLCDKHDVRRDLIRQSALRITLASPWSVVCINALLSPFKGKRPGVPSLLFNELLYANDNWLKGREKFDLVGIEFDQEPKPKTPGVDITKLLKDSSSDNSAWERQPVPTPPLSFTREQDDSDAEDFMTRGVGSNTYALPSVTSDPAGTSNAAMHSEDVAGGFLESTAHGASSLIDVRAIVDLVVGAEHCYAQFVIRDGYQTYLVDDGDLGHFRFVNETKAAETTNSGPSGIRVIRAFADNALAWSYVSKLNYKDGKSPTLMGNGFFLSKGMNNKWMMYITHPESISSCPAMPWHVVAYHNLLHQKFGGDDNIQLILKAIFQWTVFFVQRVVINDLEQLVNELCSAGADRQKKYRENLNRVYHFFEDGFQNVKNLNDDGEVSDTLVAELLSDDQHKDVLDLIKPNEAERAALNAPDGGPRRADLQRCVRMLKANCKAAIESSRNGNIHNRVRRILQINNMEHEAKARGAENEDPLAVMFNHECEVVGIRAWYETATERQSNASRTLDDLMGWGIEEEFKEPNDDKASAYIHLVSAKFGNGLVEKRRTQEGEEVDMIKDRLPNRVVFLTSGENADPRFAFHILDNTSASNVIGFVYDYRIVQRVRDKIYADPDPKVSAETKNSRVQDFDRWVQLLLSSPLTESFKMWMLQYVLIPGSVGALAKTPDEMLDGSQCGTPVILSGLAQLLELPEEREKIRSILSSKYEDHFARLTFRKNNRYGVHIVSNADMYEISAARKLLESTTVDVTSAIPFGIGDVYLRIVNSFDEFCTHVIVKGLTTIPDKLLKWLCEYTFAYPWRYIVLVKTSTITNFPENKDRLFTPVTSEPIRHPEPKRVKQRFDLELPTECDGTETTMNSRHWKEQAKEFLRPGSPDRVCFIVTPPGAGKSYYVSGIEAERRFMVFHFDCSSPLLLLDSVKQLLSQSFPTNDIPHALLVADEWHFLSRKDKDSVMDWVRTKPWLKVILIANRSDTEDLEVLRDTQVVITHGRLDAAQLLTVSAKDLQDSDLSPDKVVKCTSYVAAFHAARRALFSDEFSTMRGRDKLIKGARAACEKNSVVPKDFDAFIAEQLRVFGTFFPSYMVSVFHGAMVALLPDPAARLASVQQHIRGSIHRAVPTDLLVYTAMLSWAALYVDDNQGAVAADEKEFDGLRSYREYCEKAQLERVHPAIRLTGWCCYVYKYCGWDDAPEFDHVKGTLQQLPMCNQPGFPQIEKNGTATPSQMCTVLAHSGNYADLEFINDSVSRHRALDWEEVKRIWATQYITDGVMIERILSAMGDPSLCMNCIDRHNKIVLLKYTGSGKDSFPRKLLDTIDPDLPNQLDTCDSPWLVAAWKCVQEARPTDIPDEFDGFIELLLRKENDNVITQARKTFGVSDKLSLSLLFLTWISNFGGADNVGGHARAPLEHLTCTVLNEAVGELERAGNTERHVKNFHHLLHGSLQGFVRVRSQAGALGLSVEVALSITASLPSVGHGWCEDLRLLSSVSHEKLSPHKAATLVRKPYFTQEPHKKMLAAVLCASEVPFDALQQLIGIDMQVTREDLEKHSNEPISDAKANLQPIARDLALKPDTHVRLRVVDGSTDVLQRLIDKFRKR